jgi:hypothetical protein
MDKKKFIKTFMTVLSEFGFSENGKIARFETNELIIVATVQKSQYSSSFYLNYGFLIKALSPEVDTPQDNQCDIFGRLQLTISGETKPSVDYEKVNENEFSIALRECLSVKIKPVLDFGLMKYFELFPSATSAINLKAKKYLGFVK